MSPATNFTPTGLPVMRAHAFDERPSSRTLPMSLWRLGLMLSLPDRDAADVGDLGGDLDAGQDPAFAGLGALRELDLEHAHLFVRGDRAQLFLRQVAVGVTHAVFGCAHLHDDVAAALQVVGRQPALAGRHPDIRDLRTAGQRGHGGVAERAVAHAADVEEAFRLIGVAAGAGPFVHADLLAGPGPLFFVQYREGGVAEDEGRHVLAAETAQV